ncbi:transketolase family protein [Afifella sp. IM 167]|uniref:transketolase family protein n=1 Tax=Afifella sp. IM 167 TaxID=2033586 RepID=UPI001CCE0062|nr:transketolase C-terminal domain-containing protein [Afifella sp. IM 167]MBZ8131851.1 transketolase [Afifella sp. IM 167]
MTDQSLHLGDFTSSAKSGAAVPKYYGEALVALGHERPEVVALTGDLSPATECDLFRDTFPDRFFTPGIAEANMIGVAAGMARSGDMPFVHTFCVFMSRRAFDQVAMQVAYPRTNVKLAGFLPGLTTLLGVSHQAIEDVAMMRALPNMTVIEPCGGRQIAAAVRAAADFDGPVYLRLHRPSAAVPAGVPPLPLEIGKGQLLRDGKDAVIFAAGHTVDEALAAAESLEAAHGLQVAVANMHTLKPFDRDFVSDLARRTGTVITAENHSIVGGLGSAVAETLMEAGIAARFRRLGVRDRFAEGGSTPYLFDKYGFSAPHIATACLDLLKRSGR